MKTKLLLFITAFTLGTLTILQAQHRVYVGGEFGLGIEFQRKVDPHNIITSGNRYGHSTFGTTVRYELDDKYALETGILKEPFMSYPNVKGLDYPGNSGAGDRTIGYLRIPIRLNMKLVDLNHRVSLRIYSGSSYLYFPFGEDNWNGREGINNITKEYFIENRKAWMLEGGTSLTYKLSNRFVADASINYMHGFKDLTSNKITVISGEGSERNPYTHSNASVYSKGSKLGFSIGLRYRVLELRRLND